MKASRSRGTQQQEEQAAAPLFPRVHVNETRNGPKAPPRNKMALYEQLTVPSHHYVHSPSPQFPAIWAHQASEPQQRNLDEIPSSSTSKYTSRSSQKRRKNGDGFAVPIHGRQLNSGAKHKGANHDGDGDNLFKSLQQAQNSNASVVDSAGKLVPTDVIGALGKADFWRIRKTIIRQQRIFATHVFELHRLTQVQHMLAESPVLLLERESTVPRLESTVPQAQSTPKTSSKTPASKPTIVKSTGTRSGNQNQQHRSSGPSAGLPVSTSSLQYPPSSWRSAGAYGANQWFCQPCMFQPPMPLYTSGSAPSYQPVFGSHFAPGFQFYYPQQQQQQQQWFGTPGHNPWYASYSPQLQSSTSANSRSSILQTSAAATAAAGNEHPHNRLETIRPSLTSTSTEQQQQQQQDLRTSLKNAVEEPRARVSAFSHVSPTERTTKKRGWTKVAPRPVMATPESAAGILKSIQREKRSSKTL